MPSDHPGRQFAFLKALTKGWLGSSFSSGFPGFSFFLFAEGFRGLPFFPTALLGLFRSWRAFFGLILIDRPIRFRSRSITRTQTGHPLVHIVLVVSDPDCLGVDLHEFHQRILLVDVQQKTNPTVALCVHGNLESGLVESFGGPRTLYSNRQAAEPLRPCRPRRPYPT